MKSEIAGARSHASSSSRPSSRIVPLATCTAPACFLGGSWAAAAAAPSSSTADTQHDVRRRNITTQISRRVGCTGEAVKGWMIIARQGLASFVLLIFPMRFQNRSDAGRQLAEKLDRYANRDDVVVLALPRGGLPVAYEVASRLGAPLDVFLVRKLGVPA